MNSVAFIGLPFLLLLGVIFILWPSKKQTVVHTMNMEELDTKNINCIVLFVSTPRLGESLEDSLPYKILAQIGSNVENRHEKRIWLFYSGDSENNARALLGKFTDINKMRIFLDKISDVNSAKDIFEQVNRIVYANLSLDIQEKNILCDCTSGTKPVTLGLALASLGRGKLIYFPQTTQKDAEKYIVLDTSFLKHLSEVEA